MPTATANLPCLKLPRFGSERAAVTAMRRSAVPPRTELTVSEWADQFRILDKSAAEPGRWRTDRNPIGRGIMNAFTNAAVQTIVLMGCTQLIKTESMLNMLGYAIDQNPGPTLWVCPREDDARWFAWNRARPLITECPRLRQYQPASADEFSTLEWNLQPCFVRFAWAGSPAGLAQMPIRYLFLDEVDKYPLFSGREADPISLARERQGTFWNAKTVIASTPTTTSGSIVREMGKTQELHAHLPCPRCGGYQVLTLQQVQGLGPGDRQFYPAEQIRREQLGWYECLHCRHHWTDGERVGQLGRIVWAPEGHEITPADAARGHVPFARAVGFHFWRLYSPWPSGSATEIGAQWAEAQRDPARLMNFVNSTLAQPWAEKTEENKADELRLKILSEQPEGLVPQSAMVLTAGVDVQKDHYFFVVRAWGADMESWLIRAARVESWRALEAELFLTSYALDDGTGQAAPGKQPLFVRLACVDSRYDTKAVHRFVSKWADVAAATLGRDHLVRPYQLTILDKDADGKSTKAARKAWHVDTSHYKDTLVRLIHSEPGDPSQWHLFDEPGPDYFQQMCSEHKVVVRSRTSMKTREAWMPVEANAPNHYWDAEVYCLAAADMLQVRSLRPGNQPVVYRPAAAKADATEQPHPPEPRQRSDGDDWLPKNQDW